MCLRVFSFNYLVNSPRNEGIFSNYKHRVRNNFKYKNGTPWLGLRISELEYKLKVNGDRKCDQ